LQSEKKQCLRAGCGRMPPRGCWGKDVVHEFFTRPLPVPAVIEAAVASKRSA
jgi:hypothetical protein